MLQTRTKQKATILHATSSSTSSQRSDVSFPLHSSHRTSQLTQPTREGCVFVELNNERHKGKWRTQMNSFESTLVVFQKVKHRITTWPSKSILGIYLLIGMGFLLGKYSEIRQWWWLHDIVNILKPTQLYTSKLPSVCYANYISIKKKKRNEFIDCAKDWLYVVHGRKKQI